MTGKGKQRLSLKRAVRHAGGSPKGSPWKSDPPDPPASVRETILVVDDEGAIRSLTRSVLESQGYQVLEAPNGTEALLQASLYKAPIHLLMTDVVMPGMNGPQLAQAVTQSHPELRVLFFSGYTDEALAEQGLLEKGPPFLKKPCAPDVLTRTVREILDKPNRP